MGDITEQLIEQVQHAIDTDTSLFIEGAGTKSHLGRAICDAEKASSLSLAEHTGILQYEPVELVMKARAGTTLAEIDAALAEHGQMLACDPARFAGKATIGGSFACNQAGPARPWSGSLRDHVLGVSLINGNAELLSFGGQVMKNVAGYDVSRLQAGAMGTLGVMTDISFKVMPNTAMTLTLTESMSQADAIHRMNTLAGQAKPLSGATWVDGMLYLRLSGAKSAVEGTTEKWSGDIMPADAAAQWWDDLREQQLGFFTDRDSDEPLWRFSINSAAGVYPSPTHQSDKPALWLVDWAGGQRWLRAGSFDSSLNSSFDHASLQQWAAEQGGEVTLYQGGNREGDILLPPEVAMQNIQRSVKASFDPQGIFNPKRLHQWL